MVPPITKLYSPTRGTMYSGIAARTHGPGDALEYRWGPEYRDVEGLKELVAQLPGVPLTLDHPSGLISDGTPAKVIGYVVNARLDGDHAVVDMFVSDPAGERAILNGIAELSVGYLSRRDAKRYQREFRVDHLAVVDAARCGSTCAIRTDNDDTYVFRTDYDGLHPTPTTDVSEPQETATEPVPCSCKSHAISHTDVEVAETPNTVMPIEAPAAQVAAVGGTTGQLDKDPVMDELQKKLAETIGQVAALTARCDAADHSLAAAKASLEKLEIERDEAIRDRKAAEARADKADADAKVAIDQAHNDSALKLDAAVLARVELLTNANTVLGTVDEAGQPVDRSKVSDRDLMVAVVRHVDGDDLTEEKRAGFVESAYEGAVRRHSKARTSRVDARQTIAQVRNDAAPANQNPLVGEEAERKARLESIRASRARRN